MTEERSPKLNVSIYKEKAPENSKPSTPVLIIGQVQDLVAIGYRRIAAKLPPRVTEEVFIANYCIDLFKLDINLYYLVYINTREFNIY